MNISNNYISLQDSLLPIARWWFRVNTRITTRLSLLGLDHFYIKAKHHYKRHQLNSMFGIA